MKPRNLVSILNFPLRALLLASLFMALPARADDREDEYMAIFNNIQSADALEAAGKAAPAAAKYQEAETALRLFQRKYPDWNKKTVAFRLTYVGQKVAAYVDKQAAASKDSADKSAGTANQTASQAAGLKLLENGAEPRKQLRLHPKPGDKQTLKMTMKIGIDMDMGGAGSQAMKLPALSMVFDASVKDVSNSGDISYDLVLGEMNVADDAATAPQIVDAIKAALGGVKGMSGSGIITEHGVTKSLDMKMPEGTDPQIKQALGQMNESFSRSSIQLPEEPVGVGARWQVSAASKSQGIAIQEKTTYELVALDGDRVIAKATFSETASNQKIQNPAMGGLKVDLTKMTGEGSGEFTLDLVRAFPAAAKLQMREEMSMGMNVGAQKQKLSMKMDVSVLVECPSGP